MMAGSRKRKRIIGEILLLLFSRDAHAIGGSKFLAVHASVCRVSSVLVHPNEDLVRNDVSNSEQPNIIDAIAMLGGWQRRWGRCEMS